MTDSSLETALMRARDALVAIRLSATSYDRARDALHDVRDIARAAIDEIDGARYLNQGPGPR